MPFPDKKRIIYKNNPLDQVVCQIRFPSILKIESEAPSDFQEIIRKKFPKYREKFEWSFSLQNPMKGNLAPDNISDAAKQSTSKNHEFSTKNNDWKINLTRSFLALSTKNYLRWEEFLKILLFGIDALNKVYKPMNYSRVGLRYIDIIKRSVLNLTSDPWSELLNSSIIGMSTDKIIGKSVQNFKNEFNLILSDKESKLKMIVQPVTSKNDSEECIMIDSDLYFEGDVVKEDLVDRLNYFNERSSRLIQWCVSEKLHKAMEPTNP